MYYSCVFVPLVFILLKLVRYHLQAEQKLGKTTKTAELRTAEPVELAEPTEPREMTVFTDNYLSSL